MSKDQDFRPREVPLGALPNPTGRAKHWHVPASRGNVHWGYFSKHLEPVVELVSGDYVTLECLTHQAGDDPMDAPNGHGGGQGVHILTGPVWVKDAAPGDVLEVRILDMYPRPCANPEYSR